MRKSTITLAATALLALVGAATPPQVERVIAGDGIVNATVGGVEARIRIDPGATAMPLITSELATRAGLRGGMFGTLYGVGPVRVPGRTAVTRVDFGTGVVRRRVSFAPRAYAAGLDGVVGPGGLDEPVIRFVLRRPLAGERTVTFPMVDQGGLAGGWSDRFAMIMVGGAPLRVRFDPHHARTLATAGAGVRLAAAYGGSLDGPITEAEIVFGISRPVRALTLERPLLLGPLSITTLGVRTSDNGSAASIRDASVPIDPDEIVVTARGHHDPDRDRLAIGADLLQRCSSIVFDKPAHQIRLTCG